MEKKLLETVLNPEVNGMVRSCDGSDTAIPIGRAHHYYPPVGQTYYSTDNVANWPFYITTCFAEGDCKRDIVYWVP